jgi:hypothetical protein
MLYSIRGIHEAKAYSEVSWLLDLSEVYAFWNLMVDIYSQEFIT